MRHVVAVVMVLAVFGCGEQHVASGVPARLAVLSAFPAEMAPLLAQVVVDHTETVNGRVFRVGTLAGVPVMIGLTGIGLLNAANTTSELLDRFEVSGVVVSAVAGSALQIGDVIVPEAWTFKGGTDRMSYGTDPQWLALAQRIATSGTVTLDRCTVVTNPPPTDPVCMLEQPAIVLNGVGQSSDPSTKPLACQPGGGDLYGCDVPNAALAMRSAAAIKDSTIHNPQSAIAQETPIVVDMETAAIAREVAARGLPFIAFRAVSDGAGDPLNLPPFLGQFTAYYRFAARNAAAVTVAFLKQLSRTHP